MKAIHAGKANRPPSRHAREPTWKPQENAMLATVHDDALAEFLSRYRDTIRNRRMTLAVPSFRKYVWFAPNGRLDAIVPRCPMSDSQSGLMGPGLPTARRSRLSVIFCTRSSGPCGRLQCDQGSMCPGGELMACDQKMVDALKMKLSFGPG